MRQPLLLGTLAAINIGVAFLFQWYVLITLGPGVATDAFFAGMTVPQFVIAVISTSLTQVLVPLLGGEPEASLRRQAWSFFVLVGGLFCGIAALLYVTAPSWVSLIVPGFSQDAQELTVRLTRIQLVGMVFTALTGVQTAVYHARQRFARVEFASLITGGVGLVALFFLLPSYGVAAAAWISTLRFAAHALVQLPGMGRWTTPDLRSQFVHDMWWRVKPLLMGTAYYKTDSLIDRLLLSMTSSGTLSLYYFGQQIYGAGNGILVKAIVGPLVPRLSALHKTADAVAFRHSYRRALWAIGLVTAGFLLVFLVFGEALLSLLVGYRAGKAVDIEMLWLIMLGLGGVFVCGAMGSVTASSFYARGDTRLPTRVGALTFTIYIPIKVLSFHYGGAIALAISASLYYLVNLVLQLAHLEKT
jgi:putative peptidoglycan lipid II flippase